MPPPVFRFAPSPNGPLHLGHAYSALLNAGLAAEAGGRLLLRIEDIDPARCRPEFEAAIYRDLAWLGISWETPARRQSEHFPLYGAALARLRAQGLIYPAFMSRGEIAAQVVAAERAGSPWPRDPDGAPHYPATDRDLPAAEAAERIAAGQPFAWRLRMADAVASAGRLAWSEWAEGGPPQLIPADPAAWGDVVLARREVPTSYHLAVVVDDAAQEVTHVVRGSDLYAATGVHRLLQALLGLPPPVYRHHRLVTDAAGRKLSKSDADTGLAELRARGMSPADIRSLIGIDADLGTRG